MGNKTKSVRDNVVTTYTLDNAYRLTGQQAASGNVTMAYDTRGNITSKWQQATSPMTFTLDAANQMVTMLQGSTKTTYAYDANGNLISEQTPLGPITPWSYTYDDEDRLTLEKQTNLAPNPLSTYTYSGDGLRRTAFPASGVLTTFVWDGSDYLGEY